MSDSLAAKPESNTKQEEVFPINFRVHDDDDNPYLYIDEGLGGRNLYIEVTICPSEKIKIKHQGIPFVSQQSRIKLSFRKGILPLEKEKIVLANSKKWRLTHESKETEDILVFSAQEDMTLDEQNTIYLILHNFCVNLLSKARITKVKLECEDFEYKGKIIPSDKSNRSQSVRIMNQRGKENIPLHIGFIGSHTILNDGKTPNSLKLRIRNISRKTSISLVSKNDEIPSSFIISFDCGKKNDEVALLEEENVRNIKVSIGKNWYIDDQTSDRQYSRWILTTTKEKLEQNEYVDIEISNIISSTPCGYANFYVRYENIPGYWDGQFVIPVEKSLIVNQVNNVEIGARPVLTATLGLNGNLVFLQNGQYDIGCFRAESICKRAKNPGLPHKLKYDSVRPINSLYLNNFDFSIPTQAIIETLILEYSLELVEHREFTQNKDSEPKFSLYINMSFNEHYQFTTAKNDDIKFSSDNKVYRKSHLISICQLNNIKSKNKVDLFTPSSMNGSGLQLELVLHNLYYPFKNTSFEIDIKDFTATVSYAGEGTPKNGYFTGQISAESVKAQIIKVGDIEITQKELQWLKDHVN